MFGCKTFSHIPKDARRKLDVKSIECIFVGYCIDKEYKLFHPNSHKIIASIYVVFHENANKNDKMNDTDVWHIFNDNDNRVKIDAIVQ